MVFHLCLIHDSIVSMSRGSREGCHLLYQLFLRCREDRQERDYGAAKVLMNYGFACLQMFAGFFGSASTFATSTVPSDFRSPAGAVWSIPDIVREGYHIFGQMALPEL